MLSSRETQLGGTVVEENKGENKEKTPNIYTPSKIVSDIIVEGK